MSSPSTTDYTPLLLKLDGSNGSVLWSKAYGSNTPDQLVWWDGIWDIGVDDQNSIVFTGGAGSDTSFGGPALGTNNSDVSFIAKVTSGGAHVFSYALSGFSASLTDPVSWWYSSPLAVHPSGAIALSGWGDGGTTIKVGSGSIMLPGTGGQRYVAVLDPMGGLVWGTVIETAANSSTSLAGWWWDGDLAIDVDHNVVVDSGAYQVAASTGTATGMAANTLVPASVKLSKLDAKGMRLWTKEVLDAATANGSSASVFGGLWWGRGGVHTDSHRNIVRADTVFNTDAANTFVTGAGMGGSLAGVGGLLGNLPDLSDVIVQKLTPDGTPTWTYRFATGYQDWASGTAIDPSDNVWAAHAELSSTTLIGGDLVITKLAP